MNRCVVTVLAATLSGFAGACSTRTAETGQFDPLPDGAPPAPRWVVPQRAADGDFPPSLLVGGRALRCNGTGLCEWGLFGIDLYVAALYAERPCHDLGSALEPEQPLVIHLHFVRSLTAAQLGEAFTASVKVNTGEQFSRFQQPLERLCAAMRPVSDGSTLTFVCEPGRGVAVVHDGVESDRLDDEDFRRLFVSLYLGDKPPTPALRDGLLGKR